MNSARIRPFLPLIALCAIVALVLLAPEAAYAAPGGIIKLAAKSTFGKIIMAVLAIIFLPFIIYFSAKSAIQTRRTLNDLKTLTATMPHYRWLDAKDRVTEVFQWVWEGWTQHKMSLADGYITPWYRQNQQLQLDQWEREGLENVCRVEKIENIKPLFVQHNAHNNGEGSRLVVMVTAKVVDYLREKSSGRIVQGDDKVGELETVWTFKWEEGAWKLNLIEDGQREFEYLFAPNELPQSAPVAQTI